MTAISCILLCVFVVVVLLIFSRLRRAKTSPPTVSCVFVLLLLVLSIIFFFLEPTVQHRYGPDSNIKVIGYPLLGPEFRVLLGVAIVFCEMIIMVASGSIITTLENAIKLLMGSLKLLPLFVFGLVASQTFWPIIANEIIPASTANSFGISQDASFDLTTTVNDRSFRDGILLTLVTLAFFAIANRVFYPPKPKPAKPSKWGEIHK